MPRSFLPLLALGATLLLSACAGVPITPRTIAGRYEYEGRPEGMWYGGEMIVLGEGTFDYTLYTPDLVATPGNKPAAIHGRYQLDGATITFLNPSVQYPERTLTRRGKLFVLWTPPQIEDFHQNGRRPTDLLYQHR